MKIQVENSARKIPTCISFPPDLLDFYDQLAEHEGLSRNKLIISMLQRIKDTVEEDD